MAPNGTNTFYTDNDVFSVLTVTEVANQLGKTTVRVKQLLASGDLCGRKAYGVHLVSKASVLRYLEFQRSQYGVAKYKTEGRH